MLNLAPTQDFMRRQQIDGWLLYDFRGNNPVFAQLLPGQRTTTRRAMLFIPATGDPVLLQQTLDANQFEGLGIRRETYVSWRDLHAWLAGIATGRGRIAMEYAPANTLPVVSIADAGIVELVRGQGLEVVSSANLIQMCVARWSAAAVEQHAVASRKVTAIKDAAFARIREGIAAGQTPHEHEIAQFIRDRFKAEGLEWPDGPIVAVNAHSGDPHYEPSPEHPTPIRPGDWVLIDLWARQPGDENIYSDITWVGVVASKPSDKQREVFETVKAARDGALRLAVDAWQAKQTLQGWQLDDAARAPILAAGYEHAIKHRTGHSLSPGPKVHGLGFNLDNLETHDTRAVLPGLGFTIEPGIYLPEFGVRLEIDAYVDPQRGPVVTSCVQNEIVLLG